MPDDAHARRPLTLPKVRVSEDVRDDYQSQPEHGEALRASGLLDGVTEMRSRAFEDADLTLL